MLHLCTKQTQLKVTFQFLTAPLLRSEKKAMSSVVWKCFWCTTNFCCVKEKNMIAEKKGETNNFLLTLQAETRRRVQVHPCPNLVLSINVHKGLNSYHWCSARKFPCFLLIVNLWRSPRVILELEMASLLINVGVCLTSLSEFVETWFLNSLERFQLKISTRVKFNGTNGFK